MSPASPSLFCLTIDDSKTQGWPCNIDLSACFLTLNAILFNDLDLAVAKITISCFVVGEYICLLKEEVTFEIEGINMDSPQLKGVENAYIAADNMLVGVGNKIPL